MTSHTGSCVCGGVRFEIEGPLPAPDACHCTQCRKSSGHFWASTDIDQLRLTFQNDKTLQWFSSSEKVRRGFCGMCGSSLFWDPIEHATIAVAMGAIDSPTDTKLAKHIFVSLKGDYYEIADGVVQNLT